jgi:glycosyltransferase involved in cell wall biosynthesis
MRVTFVLPEANLGGGTRVIAQHADYLRRRGHSVFLVSTPPWKLSLRHRFAVLRRDRTWPRFPKKFPSHLDGMGFDHHVMKRRRPVTDHDVPDADVVIATWWETADGVNRLSPSKGAKAYLIQHYEADLGQPDASVAATWRMPLQKIVVAEWLADMARDRFGDPSAIVVRNGLDLDLFDAPERGRQAQPTVGMMYSSNHSKGWDIGVRAYELAAKRVPGLRMRSFGVFPPAGAMPPRCEFTLCPPQDQLRAIYAMCDVWVSSSRSEGFCLPPIEAMACRCPAIATKVGGLTELIQDGVNGYLVDVDDVDRLADRLVSILDTTASEWKRMSDIAYDRARNYSTADAGERFEQALFATITPRQPVSAAATV